MKVIIKCFKSIYLAINQLPEPTHILNKHTVTHRHHTLLPQSNMESIKTLNNDL